MRALFIRETFGALSVQHQSRRVRAPYRSGPARSWLNIGIQKCLRQRVARKELSDAHQGVLIASERIADL
jgi:hypothetical protein